MLSHKNLIKLKINLKIEKMCNII